MIVSSASFTNTGLVGFSPRIFGTPLHWRMVMASHNRLNPYTAGGFEVAVT